VAAKNESTALFCSRVDVQDIAIIYFIKSSYSDDISQKHARGGYLAQS
jgi:hypothetical protein